MGNFQKGWPHRLIRSGATRPHSIQFVIRALDACSHKGGDDA